MKLGVVLDTNVLVSGLRSRDGASFRVLELIPSGFFDLCVSVPLLMEYESVLHRPGLVPISPTQIDGFLDYVCSVSHCQDIHYLWRPILLDPKDDMVLEAAVNAGAQAIVTHNTADFRNAKGFDLQILTPNLLLQHLKASTS